MYDIAKVLSLDARRAAVRATYSGYPRRTGNAQCPLGIALTTQSGKMFFSPTANWVANAIPCETADEWLAHMRAAKAFIGDWDDGKIGDLAGAFGVPNRAGRVAPGVEDAKEDGKVDFVNITPFRARFRHTMDGPVARFYPSSGTVTLTLDVIREAGLTKRVRVRWYPDERTMVIGNTDDGDEDGFTLKTYPNEKNVARFSSRFLFRLANIDTRMVAPVTVEDGTLKVVIPVPPHQRTGGKPNGSTA